MNARNFADLVEAIETWIGDAEDGDRGAAMITPGLAEEMAAAARTVYDACMNGQRYYIEETE